MAYLIACFFICGFADIVGCLGLFFILFLFLIVSPKTESKLSKGAVASPSFRPAGDKLNSVVPGHVHDAGGQVEVGKEGKSDC